MEKKKKENIQERIKRMKTMRTSTGNFTGSWMLIAKTEARGGRRRACPKPTQAV